MSLDKKAMGIQVMFFIFMSIIMVSLIIFGFTKMSELNDIASEEERIDMKNKFEKEMEFCSDPLNRGSKKVVMVDVSGVNGVCVFDKNTAPSEISSFSDISDIQGTLGDYDSGVVFVNAKLVGGVPQEVSVVDFLKVDKININKCDFTTSRRVSFDLVC